MNQSEPQSKEELLTKLREGRKCASCGRWVNGLQLITAIVKPEGLLVTDICKKCFAFLTETPTP